MASITPEIVTGTPKDIENGAADENKTQENKTQENKTQDAKPIEEGEGTTSPVVIVIALDDVKSAFAAADTDKTGGLTAKEIQTIEEKFGLPLDISSNATDWKDGTLTLIELLALLKANGNVLPTPIEEWKPSLYFDIGFHSKGWMEHAGGFCKHYQDDSKLCIASSVCPCLVAAVNASELVNKTGAVGSQDLNHDPKWILQVAALYCMNPCAVGSAIREEIWKHATLAGEQRPGRLIHKKSFSAKARFFCLPHCCCCCGCCCAVAQDRRALTNAFKVMEEKKCAFQPTFTPPLSKPATGNTGTSTTGNAKS